MPSLKLNKIVKDYGNGPVIHGLNLDISDNEFVALVGPSGCGKSTLLRMIAGLEHTTGGVFSVDGKDLTHATPQNRNMAMVFQSYALYPHMTVYDNIAFGPRIRGESENEYDKQVREAAEKLNLTSYLDKYPRQLSGGQRQRVAMGRAIVRDTRLFLFDEPLSNLDAKLRTHMRSEIRSLHNQLNSTTLYVTHDQIEAMTMADRIVVMNQGRIEQTGSPLELYDNPANIFVATFLGSPAMNIFEGSVIQSGDSLRVAFTDQHVVSVPAPSKSSVNVGDRIMVGARPQHLIVTTEQTENSLPMTVSYIEQTGAECFIGLEFLGEKYSLVSQDRIAIEAGTQVHVAFSKTHLFDKNTEIAL